VLLCFFYCSLPNADCRHRVYSWPVDQHQLYRRRWCLVTRRSRFRDRSDTSVRHLRDFRSSRRRQIQHICGIRVRFRSVHQHQWTAAGCQSINIWWGWNKYRSRIADGKRTAVQHCSSPELAPDSYLSYRRSS